MRNTCRKTYLQKFLQFFFFTDIISFKNTTYKLSNNFIVFIFIFTLDWSISVMVTDKDKPHHILSWPLHFKHDKFEYVFPSFPHTGFHCAWQKHEGPLSSGEDITRPLTKISPNRIQTYRSFIILVTFGSFSIRKRFWDWYFSESIFLYETVFHEAKP